MRLILNQTQAYSRPTAAQTLVVIALAIATSATLYSQWFHECCMDASRDWIGILTLPAMLVSLLLAGGKVHGASHWHFYFGLAVQFYLILCLIRWLKLRKRVFHKVQRD